MGHHMTFNSEQMINLARNLVDRGVVAYIIYRVLLMIKGTRAAPMLAGLSVVLVMYFAAQPLGFVSLAWILGNFLSSIILVVVILFQDDIRRGLTKVGLHPLFRKSGRGPYNKTIEDITLVATKMGRDRLGAIIVIQRDVGLDEFLEDSTALDAVVNRKLLQAIFVKESPLHDGAVVIEGDRIKAAGCVLPLSFDPDLDPNLGTRHRAALGLSERSDAVIVVISEETGSVSLVREGRIVRNLDGAQLREALLRLLAQDGDSEEHEDEA